MKNRKLITALVLGLFIFTACASKKETAGSSSLLSRTWTLVAAGDVDAGTSGAFIEFGNRPGEVRGKAGCNGFGGNYAVNGKSLKLEGLMGTKMACPALNVENAFMQALGSTDTYKVEGDRLLLYKGDQLLATFKGSSVGN